MPERVRTKSKPKAVLILQHIDYGNAAILERSLRSQGIPTFVRSPYLGEAFPERSGLAGVISMGGPMSAYDLANHAWIKKECEFLRRCVEEDLPVIGICLGAQLLAIALGGRVVPNPKAEIGWYPIRLNDAGLSDPILSAAGSDPIVYHWHMDTFELPPGAELLAESKVCARQAFRVGHQVYGFQFHPEADHQLIGERFERHGNLERIKEYRRIHGTETVQDAYLHHGLAPQGERASLKIAAALAQIFRKEPFTPVAEGFRSMIETFAVHRTDLQVRIRGVDRHHRLRLQGTIYNRVMLNHVEFIVFQEHNRRLWPVRLDDIHSAVPLDARSNRL